jgi:hypothetical protein
VRAAPPWRRRRRRTAHATEELVGVECLASRLGGALRGRLRRELGGEVACLSDRESV